MQIDTGSWDTCQCTRTVPIRAKRRKDTYIQVYVRVASSLPFHCQTIGTMTTPTASAVVSLESAELPRNNSARSAGPVSSTSDRGTRSGPVDLDETQQTIDSETAVETNNNPSARDGGAHEQNAGVPSGTDVVMQNLLDDMVSTLIVASLFCSYSPKYLFQYLTSLPSSFLLFSCPVIRPSTSIRWVRPFWDGSTKWGVGLTMRRELSAI